MQSRVGQQFGNYRLLSLLGKGGFAEVYLGEHIYMGSRAAIKVLYGEIDPSNAQSFLKEAQTLASLEHPHIVGIKEFDIKDDTPFLVMSYASSGTLRQRHVRGQRVPLGIVVPYVLQVADALQYAHDRRVVHRDLKPENMLVGDSGNILLSDFGIAVLYSTTRSYGLAGTYFYMAPEQIGGKPVPASDQYALGITVYEWLCGEVPFNGSPNEIITQHLTASPPAPRERGVALAPQVEAVVMRALAKDPRQRYASIQEFALALQSGSQALPRNSIHLPSTGSGGSFLLSPPVSKTSGFAGSFVQSPQPLPSGSTPRVSLPSTVYPNNPPYVPTQPASPYPSSSANRRIGLTCLVMSLISVVLLLAIGVGAFFTISSLIGHTSSAGLNSITSNLKTNVSLPTNVSLTTNTPEGVISDFCQNLKMKNYQSAYDEYTKHLQSQISFTEFENYWSANNKEFYSIDRCDHQTITTPSGSSVTATWSTHDFYTSQVKNYSVTFVIEGNAWKIDQITEV